MILDGKKVFEAFMVEKGQNVENDNMRKIFEDLCINHIPRIFSAHLDKKADVRNIVSSKLECIRICVNEGWIEKLFMSSNAADMMPDFKDFMIIALPELVEKMEEMNASVLTEIEKYGVPESIILESMGMNEDNIEKALAGKFLIRDLLLTQPAILISSD